MALSHNAKIAVPIFKGTSWSFQGLSVLRGPPDQEDTTHCSLGMGNQ
jgi:hypothetical protein